MIEIISPGPMTTVQDGGRTGYMRYGVSRAGAMDAFALSLANLIVGNARGEGAIEATLATPSVRFLDDALFAVTGGRCELRLDGESVPMDAAVSARAGQTLAAAPILKGCRSYIALAGGFGLERMLGSVSCDPKAGVGGLGRGQKLARGDRLPNAMPKAARGFAGRALPAGLYDCLTDSEAVLRATIGPQAEALDAEGEGALFGSEYTVLPESDRMGIRLAGNAVSFAPGNDGNIITDAVCAGAVQITGSGMPILMMADAQTTGGYAKPAWVIGADLPVAAQLRPGDRVRFERCSVEEAQAALAAREDVLSRIAQKWATRSMRVTAGGNTYEISLYEVFPT